MKYHIGLISKLLGLSAGGIRLYERGGIVRSQREGDGGYRFYERPDIVSLMLAMSYRGCGFTLGEAEALVNTDDPDFVAESLRRREEKLEAEIRRKKLILERMRENRRMIENAPSEFGMVELRERPAFYRLEFMRGGDLILRPEDYSLFRKWRELSPFVFPSLRGNWEKFLREGLDENVAGLGLMESDAKLLGAERIAGRGIYYPPCPCIRAVMRIEGRFPAHIGLLPGASERIRGARKADRRGRPRLAHIPLDKQERRGHKIPRNVAARRGGLTLHQV